MVRPVIRVPYAEDTPGQVEPSSFSNRSANQRHLMSKIPSLVFDMEDTEEHNTQSCRGGLSVHDQPAITDVVQKLQSLLEPWSEAEYMVLLHVRIAREEALKRGEPHLTVVELADTLRRLGYRVKLRTALGGGWGGACLRNLRHSFLAVTVEGPNGGTQLVVDPRFKEQFEIAHATPRYTQILEAVPTEAVVPQDRLNSAVEALCKELAAAFQASSIPLPPWRQAAAMMSKWQPRRSEEVEVMSGGERGQVDTAAVINNAVGVAPPRKAANNNNNNSKNIVAQVCTTNFILKLLLTLIWFLLVLFHIPSSLPSSLSLHYRSWLCWALHLPLLPLSAKAWKKRTLQLISGGPPTPPTMRAMMTMITTLNMITATLSCPPPLMK